MHQAQKHSRMAKATHADRARALMSNYITFNNACQKRSSLLRPVEWVRRELDLSGAMFYREMELLDFNVRSRETSRGHPRSRAGAQGLARSREVPRDLERSREDTDRRNSDSDASVPN
ncbi:hypothetical protein ARMGADRAFT_1069382 [Armillaria gallica]|uniref:Uncharacterized protein n=1 Tax=Armillaria gallica TaxID=47427 RepID=A0A2H3CS62_ARMGA|nr:hypothetical protein ARMGADRAFT_1069382 [Armillaria gallica]